VIVDDRVGAQIARKGTSDWPDYDEIFSRGIYKFKHSVRPKVIVDLGTNVGYSAVWYHKNYREALVVAVEANPSAASAALVNIALAARDGGRVELEHTAVWNAVRSDPSSSRTVTMNALMDRHALRIVDVVKVRIARAEEALFDDNTDWLDRVNSLVIELDDEEDPSRRKAVVAALDRHFVHYDEVVRGAYSLFTRRHRLEERQTV
jgi:tRNA G37 N-methylase Trm5